MFLGFSVLQVMATDKDQGDNGEFTYQLNDPKGAFLIDPRTGWLTVRNQVSNTKYCYEIILKHWRNTKVLFLS